MSHVHFTNPEVLASLRREYEQKIEHDSAALDELHLGREQLQAEELQWARRHLQVVEKNAVIGAFHRGLLSQAVQEKLLADIDAQLLRLESAEADGSSCPNAVPGSRRWARLGGIDGHETLLGYGRTAFEKVEGETMSKPTRTSHPLYNLLPTEIEGFDSLAELALDMRWSWNHATDEVWRQLDPELWEFTHNPWVVLQTVSNDRIESVFADPAFRKNVNDLVQTRRQAAETPAWFQQNHPQAPLNCVAYFSMEFMLSEALPIYSGGLGNVAGDQLKAASDLGVPVVGVGLLYQQGYFRQVIDKDGAQQALFPYNDPGQLPITPLRQANGEWLRLEIVLPGYSVWLRAWQVQVGRVKLYLLDSNDAANFPAHRGITSEFYGGGPELRLKQELLLGIGGWRLLAALGIKPDVCHLNEGHAAFAVLGTRPQFHAGHRAAI